MGNCRCSNRSTNPAGFWGNHQLFRTGFSQAAQAGSFISTDLILPCWQSFAKLGHPCAANFPKNQSASGKAQKSLVRRFSWDGKCFLGIRKISCGSEHYTFLGKSLRARERKGRCTIYRVRATDMCLQTRAQDPIWNLHQFQLWEIKVIKCYHWYKIPFPGVAMLKSKSRKIWSFSIVDGFEKVVRSPDESHCHRCYQPVKDLFGT